MARLFIDGFETGDWRLWDPTSNPWRMLTSPPDGMTGTYMMDLGSGPLNKTFSANKSELYMAFKWYPYGGASNILTFFDDAGTPILNLYKNGSNNFLYVYRGQLGANPITGGIGTHGMLSNRAYLVELHYIPLNSNGTIQIKLDGIMDIDVTTQDTTNGQEHIRGLIFGDYPHGNYATAYLDDVVIDDSSWIGNTKVGLIKPTGASPTHTDWTPSTGANWECVNEIPPNVTDNVTTGDIGDIDTYTMDTISGMNTVKCIQVQALAAYEGTPSPAHIQLGARYNSVDDFATDLSPGIAYGMLTRIMETKPGGGAWGQTSIDDVECGVKATA